MEINSERAQGEMRDGYYVQPLLKRIWAVQLDILKEIDTICTRHHIHYYGWYGTMLGAVRHQGFIPWDDDMDLAMLREDYERFRYYAKTELPAGWRVTEEIPANISVFHTDTIRLDQDFLDKFHNCPYITGIDIFCLDSLPENKDDEQVQIHLFQTVYNLCVNWELPEDDAKWRGDNKWDFLNQVEELTGQHIDRQSPIKQQLYFLADRIAAMYWNEESEEVTIMPELYKTPHYRIPIASFDRVIEKPFETISIPFPKDYDLICRLKYGTDYMTPVKTEDHDYLKKQVNFLREYFNNRGEAFPACYDMHFDS